MSRVAPPPLVSDHDEKFEELWRAQIRQRFISRLERKMKDADKRKIENGMNKGFNMAYTELGDAHGRAPVVADDSKIESAIVYAIHRLLSEG